MNSMETGTVKKEPSKKEGQSKELKQLKQKKLNFKKAMIAIFLFAVLVLSSVLIYRYYSKKTVNSEKYDYNGYVFEKVGPLWYTQVQKGSTVYDVPLHYSPKDLKNISISGEVSQDFYRKQIYISIEPNETDVENSNAIVISAIELQSSLISYFEKEVVLACIRELSSCGNKSIISSCKDTDMPVIFFNATGESKIILSGKCITLQGRNLEMLRSVDRFLLGYYGIMKFS